MKEFTGWEYLLIDVANHYGLDGLRYEERLDWANTHLNKLEEMYESCKKKTLPLFKKTVMTIRKAQQGIATGHLVGFDAVCSGMQIMSAATGCYSGAKATGLIEQDVRSDAYRTVAEFMAHYLGGSLGFLRDDVKKAVMTVLYGSKKEPEKLFGRDTSELVEFYKSMWEVAPGAMHLLNDLVASWNPDALSHSWRMPDNHYVYIPVMVTEEKRIEVDELAHSTFTYAFKTNEPQDYSVSNAANVVHSVDAWLLRSLDRRCNYDPVRFLAVKSLMQDEMLRRTFANVEVASVQSEVEDDFSTMLTRYEESGIADLAFISLIDEESVKYLPDALLEAMYCMVMQSLEHKPFPILSVHDEFKCHPNNMNHLRKHYNQIMVQINQGRIMEDILTQLNGVPTTIQRDMDLTQYIEVANYPIN